MNIRAEQQIFNELESLCRSKGFVHAVSFFCFKGLIKGTGEIEEKDLEELYAPQRLTRTEMTTLVGLLIRGPIDFSLPDQKIVQQYITRSQRLLEEIHQSMWNSIPRSSLYDLETWQSGAFLREVIFYGGESSYPVQVKELAPLRYKDDCDWLLEKRNFDLNIARDVFRGLEEVLSNKSKEIKAKFWFDLAKDPSDTLNNLTALPLFSFTGREIADYIGCPYDKVKSFIDAFTLPERNYNSEFRSLHDFNAAYAYPIIRKGPAEFVLFQYSNLAESLYDSPFYWMLADKKYSNTASRNRGVFAEEFSCRRLSLVFENVYKNVKIVNSNGDVRGEIDVLVVYGDHLIILQAKSKKLTLEARRGNDLILRADFREAVGKAVDQAISCSELIQDSSLSLQSGGGIIIPLEHVPQVVFPITVVADHFPGLTFQAKQFLTPKTTEVIRPPLVTDIFTLDLITEFLDSPLRLLSYLKLHAQFGDKLFMNHEITALACHLKHNLWIQRDIQGELLTDDLCASIDVALAVRRLGMEGERTPRGILTRYVGTPWEKIVSAIQKNPDPGFIRLGLHLLEFGSEGIEQFNGQILKLLQRVAEDGQRHDFSLPAPEYSTGLTIHSGCFSNEEASQELYQHCFLRKYMCHADTWYGLSIYPDFSPQLAIVFADPWESDEEIESYVSTLPLSQEIKLPCDSTTKPSLIISP